MFNLNKLLISYYLLNNVIYRILSINNLITISLYEFTPSFFGSSTRDFLFPHVNFAYYDFGLDKENFNKYDII